MTKNTDYIVLLHGFWRTAKSLKKLEAILKKEGYIVLNPDYPSNKEKIQDITEKYLVKELREKCTDKNKKIHFVTHSMGGILVRYFLAKHKLPNLGKIIMLAPPNNGSKQADFLNKFKVVRKFLGPALSQMISDSKSFVNQLPQPDYPVGIIAGKYDGKVTIKQTKLDKMADFIVVPHFHTFIMNRPNIVKNIIHFLKKERFDGTSK